MSGEPGRLRPFVLNLHPIDLRINRTVISGHVPFCLTLDINSERLGVVLSLTNVLPNLNIVLTGKWLDNFH